MAQNPIGTITDEERLVPLYTDDGEFIVDVTEPIRMADVPDEGTFAWQVHEVGDVHRLVFAPVDDPEEAGALPTRDLTAAGDALTIGVPESLLATGLDVDIEQYDDENPLLFKAEENTDGAAVGMDVGGEPGGAVAVAIELVPVRYSDGTPYRAESVQESELDSDPVAEGELDRRHGDGTPRFESMSAPFDESVVEEVFETTDADRQPVVEALEAMTRQGLVGEGDDDSPYDPLAVDDRVVVALDDESWTENVAAELDADDAIVAVTREIHARQAEELLDDVEDDLERFDGRSPVVVQRGREHDNGSDPPWKPK